LKSFCGAALFPSQALCRVVEGGREERASEAAMLDLAQRIACRSVAEKTLKPGRSRQFMRPSETVEIEAWSSFYLHDSNEQLLSRIDPSFLSRRLKIEL
jgi:hypothetical protein